MGMNKTYAETFSQAMARAEKRITRDGCIMYIVKDSNGYYALDELSVAMDLDGREIICSCAF